MKLLLVLIILILSGCTFFGFGHQTVSGLICRDNFETGQQCTVFDPILKEQVPIDPINVITTCDLESANAKEYVCYYTYTDSMNNTWKSKTFKEKV